MKYYYLVITKWIENVPYKNSRKFDSIDGLMKALEGLPAGNYSISIYDDK